MYNRSKIWRHNKVNVISNSYVYDVESGLYYLQSRYYDPEIGRFINADAFASTGQGILGNNMFAYCLNNPANYIDVNGQIPRRDIFYIKGVGEEGILPYETEEDAAFAAGVATRKLTNNDDLEYICGVYQLDSGGYMIGDSYQGNHSSAPANSVVNESYSYNDRTLVALVHSHPYCTGHVPNEFSKTDPTGKVIGDLYCSYYFKMPVYLAAPNGDLKVIQAYVVQQQGYRCVIDYAEETIRNGLPVDNSRFDCRK